MGYFYNWGLWVKNIIFCWIQLKFAFGYIKNVDTHHESFSSTKQVIKKLSPKNIWQTYMKWTVVQIWAIWSWSERFENIILELNRGLSGWKVIPVSLKVCSKWWLMLLLYHLNFQKCSTLNMSIATIVPYANSLYPDETLFNTRTIYSPILKDFEAPWTL